MLNIVEALKYLLLGIIQGLTEVLPISSSGHVEIAKQIVGIDFSNSLLFLILVNTGSLCAFIWIYRRKLWHLIKGFIVYILYPSKREQHRNAFFMVMKIVVASIPAGIVGILFNSEFQQLLEQYGLLIVGIGLLVTATVLYIITRDEPFKGQDNQLNWKDVTLIGVAQAFALFPGISRSGMTSSTAIKRGASIDTALDFSFIMYIPVSIGSTLLLIYKAMSGEESVFSAGQTLYYVLAFVGAATATYIAYKLIFNIFKSGKLRYFSYYCLTISAIAMFIYIF